jgi:hypothetical protein
LKNGGKESINEKTRDDFKGLIYNKLVKDFILWSFCCVLNYFYGAFKL